MHDNRSLRVKLYQYLNHSLVPRPSCAFFGYMKESHRAWCLKPCDQLRHFVWVGTDSKDGCVTLLLTGDFVSAVSLWHKQAVKISYKKCRLATFTTCPRITTVLAHTLQLPFYSLACARDLRHQALWLSFL